VVAATPRVHQEVLTSALGRGIATFLEKPPAEGPAALDELAAVARAHPEVVTFVDYNFRFGVGFEKLLGGVAQAGGVASVRIRFVSRKPRAPLWGFNSVLRSYFYAVGIHAIEMALYLLGEATAVAAASRPLGDGGFVAGALLTTPDGRMAVLELGNYSNRFESQVELVMQDGTVAVLEDLRTIRRYRAEPTKDERAWTDGKAFVQYTVPSLMGGFGVGGYEGALASFRDSVQHWHGSASPIERSLPVYRMMHEILRLTGEA
jgi:predicted dehydrogenase